MQNKKGALAFLIVGILLVLIALVIKVVIYPSMAVWPDDVDAVRTYDGTLHTMLNPAALETMDLANLFMSEVPITIERHVTTEETKGNKAIVLEAVTTSAPDGSVIGLLSMDSWYAIDRKTMNAVPDFSGNDKIPHREGLVIGFPIGTEKKDYPGWNGDVQELADAVFVREEKHEESGLDTYIFEGKSLAKEIVDPEKLALFPPAVPKDLLLALAGGIELPEALQAPFAMILPNLPDLVPLKYTYEYETVYWIEPTTGVLVDYSKHEVRQVALAKDLLLGAIPEGVELPEEVTQLLPMLPDPLPLLPVMDMEYVTAASSVQDAAKDAKDNKGLIDLLGTTVPMLLVVGGLVLGVIGVVLFLRKPAEAEQA